MRLELPGARSDFERSQSVIWILNIATDEPMRGQGRRHLSRLVDALGWQN